MNAASGPERPGLGREREHDSRSDRSASAPARSRRSSTAASIDSTPVSHALVRARAEVDAARRRLVVPGRRPVPDLPARRAAARTCGTSTATSTSTRTAASARWSSATRTRRSSRRSSAPSTPDRTSRLPTEDSVLFAEELCRRFNLEQVRFANSGTEATMSAIRIARAATGRDDIVKIEGSYHGHHDSVMFSVVPNADLMGGREAPASEPMSLGVPQFLARAHARRAVQRPRPCSSKLLDERGDTIACLIIEPVMMNIGIAVPEPGYLEGLLELLHRHGALLIFDEVKIGRDDRGRRRDRALRRAARPRVLRQGDRRRHARPPRSAGEADVMDVIARGAAHQGTFNGNPLVCAAGLAALTEVLTPDAYVQLARARHPPRRRAARRRSPPTASPRTPSTSGRRAACRTGPSRCATTATSSRPTPTSTRRRTRGWSTAGCS